MGRQTDYECYSPMQRTVNMLCLAGLVAAAVGAAGLARADVRRPPPSVQIGADRWVPSAAFVSGLQFQQREAGFRSLFCDECTIPDPSQEPLRDPGLESTLDSTPFVGANLELMSPETPLPGRIPGRIRFVVGADFSSAIGLDRIIISEGDPSRAQSPLPEGVVNTPFGERVVLGQGSEVVAKLDAPLVGLYAGVAVPFSVRDRPLRVKPHLAWTRYSAEFSGFLVSAQCTPAGNNTQCNTNLAGGFLREVRIQEDESLDVDAVGLGVDLEMDVARFGPVGTALFARTRLFHVVTDRSVEWGGRASLDDSLGTDEATADFRFEVEPWMYRFALGVRLHWLGNDAP